MVYRFFVALLFTVGVFPFAVMYTFALRFPEARFAFDSATWGQGLAIVVFGWVVFLLPGLLPFVGHRYYDWVARKTGMVALYQATRSGLRAIRDRIRWLSLRTRTAMANLRPANDTLDKLRSRMRREEKQEVADVPAAEPGAEAPAARPQADRLGKARQVLADAPRHLAKAKSTFHSLREKLTPDELQRTIDLNQYTLETFSHLKEVLRSLLPSANLVAEERNFVELVLNAVPEPPSPSAVHNQPVSSVFDYPPALREALQAQGTKKKIVVRDEDFELAKSGDLERALFLVRALLVTGDRREQVSNDVYDDPMVGLSFQGSA